MYNNKNQKAMTRMIAMFMAVLMNCLVGGTLAGGSRLSDDGSK